MLFFVGRAFPDQIVYLASACNYDASEKKKMEWWTHGDFHMYGYISHLAIFCRLALDLGHQILALELEFAAVDLRGVDSLTGHLFALSFSCIFLFIQLHCLYCERNLFHCIEIQKIVLYQLVVLY